MIALPATERDALIIEFTVMRDPHRTLMVWQFLLGQYRLQITDKRRPDADAPQGHGEIVQQCCTSRFGTAVDAIAALRFAEDALALARSWARPWNCEGEGGRIRLDSTERKGAA